MDRTISICVGVFLGLLSLVFGFNAWESLYRSHNVVSGIFFVVISTLLLAACVSFLREAEPRGTPGGFEVLPPPAEERVKNSDP